MKKNYKDIEYFIRYILLQIKNFYKLALLSLFLTICYSVSVIVTPYITRRLIDLFTKGVKLSDVWFVVLVFLVTCFVQPALFFFNSKIMKMISEKIILKIRCLLFDKVINAPFSFFCKNSSGSIISHLVNDSNQVGVFLSTGINTLFKNILYVILISICMFFISKPITILLCILLFIYVAFNIFFNKNFEKRSEEIYKNNDEFYKIIKQCTDNIEEIKITQQESTISSSFLDFAKDFCYNKLKLYNLHNILDSVNATIGILSISLIYITGFFLISKDKLTIGSVVAFVVYFYMIMPSIKQLLQLNSDYHEVLPAFLRLSEYFKINPEPRIAAQSLTGSTLSVCFDNVTFKYNDDSKDHFILKNFSFKMVAPGLYGIVGKSGIGKSTIARLIVGFYRPLSGNIAINVDKKFASNIRSCMGYASQNMRLFYGATVMYNITLGNKSVPYEKVERICEKLNLHSKILNLPSKYEEVVTEKVNFSGGEIQRIILARIYLQKKPIVILDEITSALDAKNTKIVKNIIEDMAKNSLVILLTHNLSLLDNASQIIKLQD